MYDIKLLIVEDDTVIRGIYQRVLEKSISKIILAKNGEEGYEIFKKEKPDLILSDIKMPVINGLDMINKIRQEDKSVRIIIMSAYGESKYFINAIETGVKGFLIKPIKNDHLTKIVSEQANDILLERKLKLAEKKRKAAEIGRKKSDKILNTLSAITATFFQKGLNASSLLSGLQQIGEATESSRVVIYKFKVGDNKIIASLQDIWRKDINAPDLIRDDNRELEINTPTLLKWYEILKANGNVRGNIRDLKEPTRKIFEFIKSKSIIAIPVFVNEDLWGFISLDDIEVERDWLKSEISALYSFAYNLGAAIYRKNAEQELIHMNINLEKRVRERTQALENEIIEKTNTQELLKGSEEKYRLIYENASDGILLIQKAKIVLINPTMVVLMEAMPRDLIGRKFHSFIKSSNKNQLRDFFNSEIDDIEESTFEIMISTKNDKEKWLELKINSIDWDGEPGFLVFASDVTLRNLAQQNLKQLNISLEERITKEVNNVKKQQELLIHKSKLESLGELSAGLAHEINQPLGGISMGLENIIYKMTQGDLNEKYLNTKINVLFQDIDRIKNIIEHVRTFSRGQENTSIETLNVGDVLKSAISLINRQYENQQVEIFIDIPEWNLMSMGNPFRLEQVFLNILTNAKSAVDHRSEQLKAGEEYHKKIKLHMETDNDYIYVNISDNGIGMSKSVMDKIFEPFFTTKDLHSGTGLGLSISYGIISEMNGEIRVESEPDACTKLTIELPLIEKTDGKA